MAHLQETLQQRMATQPHQSVVTQPHLQAQTNTAAISGAISSTSSCASDQQSVKAVVHRGPESRTLDGQSIKQYESIKMNQVPWSLGPYDTIKPSR